MKGKKNILKSSEILKRAFPPEEMNSCRAKGLSDRLGESEVLCTISEPIYSDGSLYELLLMQKVSCDEFIVIEVQPYDIADLAKNVAMVLP